MPKATYTLVILAKITVLANPIIWFDWFQVMNIYVVVLEGVCFFVFVFFFFLVRFFFLSKIKLIKHLTCIQVFLSW